MLIEITKLIHYRWGSLFQAIDMTNGENIVCMTDDISRPSAAEFKNIADPYKAGRNIFDITYQSSGPLHQSLWAEYARDFKMSTPKEILKVKTWNIPEGIDIFLF